MAKRDMNDLLKRRMSATQQAAEVTVGDEAYEMLFQGKLASSASKFCDLPLDRLRPFFTADIGFHPYPQEKLKAFSQQLAEQGIYERIIVRPIPESEDYEILAGHNRTEAWRLTGHTTIPAEVVNADDARAVSIAVATNLLRRQDLTIIERGKAYKAVLDAEKRQGSRTDIGTSGENRQKFLTREIVADFFGVTEYEIRKAIKLAGLIPPLADILENNPRKLPIACAELIADYDAATQQAFVEMCSSSIPVRLHLQSIRTFSPHGGRHAQGRRRDVLHRRRKSALTAENLPPTLRGWAVIRKLKSCFWSSCGNRSTDV